MMYNTRMVTNSTKENTMKTLKEWALEMQATAAAKIQRGLLKPGMEAELKSRMDKMLKIADECDPSRTFDATMAQKYFAEKMA